MRSIEPVSFAAISPEIMGAVGVCVILVTAVVGFVAGMLFARTAGRRSLDRTKRNLSDLYDHVLKSIGVAQDACRILETFPKLQLSLEQLEKLDGHRTSLVTTMQRIAEKQQPAPPPPVVDEVSPVVVPELAWIRTPEHTVTKLPDRTAFDANTELLLRTGSEIGFTSGVLLVKMDKVDDLKVRFGLAGIQSFQRRLASLIVRTMRNPDIVCFYAAETFAVLMPGVDATSGREASDAIRQAIRLHHFRSGEKGPEVLVTASFGFALSAPADTAELVRSRAESALSRSQQKGRNQLHCDDGRQLVLCKD